MITFAAGFLLAASAAQSPGSDSLRVGARHLTDSALVVEARARPLVVREALVEALSKATTSPARDAKAELAVAARLAAAHAGAWRDSFLIRQVAWFAAASPARRAAKIRADSLRRAGVSIYHREGPRRAIAIWRRALVRAAVLPDTAGMAATLGNIGAALARLGRLDSATVDLERSRDLAQTVGDLRVEANSVAELAGIRNRRDDVAGARSGYARALALRERIGDLRGLAADYNNLSLLARRLGDLPEAERQLEAALALNRREQRDDVAATNLVNLAELASEAGDFGRAGSYFREALGIWSARAAWTDVADARRGLGQLEMRRGDYPAARVELLEALALYQRTDLLEDVIKVRQQLAGTLAAAGDLQGALDQLRLAQRAADSARVAPAVAAGVTLARADLAVQLNARSEADRLYSAAELLFRRAGDRAGEAEAQAGRGLLFLNTDDPLRAQGLLDAALRTQLAAGNRRAAALTRLSLGELALERGDTAAARRQLIRAGTELSGLGDPIGAAVALGERATLEASASLPAAAESLFRAALATVGTQVAPEVTWRLHAGLGALRQRTGAIESAAIELGASIADIERSSRSLRLPERRSSYLADKWSVYSQLALLEHDRGRLDRAFELSERVRARELIEMLGHGRIVEPVEPAGELVAREQDLRRRIAELTREVAREASGDAALRGPDVYRSSAIAREALVRAQGSYTELLLEMRERAPRHRALISSNPPAARDLGRYLARDELFVEYLVGETRSLAFLVARDTVAAIDLDIGRRELAKLVDFTRGTLEPRGSARLDSLWRAPLRRLHHHLITPIDESGLLAGKTRITLVPHAELHYLPFAALIDPSTGRFLVERYEIAVTPSASVWLALGDRPARRATEGALGFAPRPEVLPASRQEVEAVGRLGGARSHLAIGTRATELAFRREAPTRSILHLATYGVLNQQNPLFSYVELVPEGGDDGRLEVHEVFGLRLTAELVVLSACQTGLASGAESDVPPGDDWVGLARAFLYAGAARVVASLWPVEDRPTADLMERFYREYEGNARWASALARAQRALLATPATAHPYYWAGFELVGAR